MAHNVSKAGFPNIPLEPGMIIRLEARDTTTDAAVAGVTATLWSIYGGDSAAGDDGDGIDDVIPLYTATSIGDPP